MGRKRLERQSVESLFASVSSLLVPEHILQYFDIWDAHEYKERWVIAMREKEGLIPQALSEYEDVVFDGYNNPIDEIINFFPHGMTNAKAERLNGKIQRFVSSNYGIKDKDFSLYRIAGYFS